MLLLKYLIIIKSRERLLPAFGLSKLFNLTVKAAGRLFFDDEAAVVAHNAFCFALSVCEFLCEVGLADERSAHRDTIRFALGENIFHIADLMYSADNDNGN